MKKINNEELKKIQLKLLDELDSFCFENNLKYSLAYGSLLGAVRHKGYIPWDDDIDVFMLRKDYDVFVAKYTKEDHSHFVLICHDSCEWYPLGFSKLSFNSTVIIEDNCSFSNKIGVNIDIFPIDFLSDTVKDSRKIFSKTKIKKGLIIASTYKKNLLKGLYRKLAFFVSRFINPIKEITKIEKKYCKKEKKLFAGCLFSPYSQKEIMSSNIYNEFKKVEFEGKEYLAIKKYDEYLSNLYGDYMTLPPEDKRVSNHGGDAYYTD